MGQLLEITGNNRNIFGSYRTPTESDRWIPLDSVEFGWILTTGKLGRIWPDLVGFGRIWSD